MARAINRHQMPPTFDSLRSNLMNTATEGLARMREAEGLEMQDDEDEGGAGYLAADAEAKAAHDALTKTEARQQHANFLKYLATPNELVMQ
jgi:hypothetical protein